MPKPETAVSSAYSSGTFPFPVSLIAEIGGAPMDVAELVGNGRPCRHPLVREQLGEPVLGMSTKASKDGKCPVNVLMGWLRVVEVCWGRSVRR